ncbi:S-layer homology domain-containing protein [Paenibacillus sp. J5C_2022]|uniref:S-layer homology domain-containing protein n=1 Tax=Paenibacillus sp. J5C2022 TaxID=2977129 RepID=UPI0021D134F3|nr:S-layer homology domain-containing protein [Paenibacillus sp. J5C2022]MCU6710269.1 S-layer homology domain-containing protein [Paenibacillus sp. J5C2022]
MTGKNKWKKTLIGSMALLLLASGGTSAFANGKGHDDDRGKGKGWYDDKRDHDDDDDDDDDDKYKVKWHFEDEEELEWAMEYIMRLASKGVFTGYEDGTFKPKQKISRIETLTAAVRLMGLREQAESAEEMSTELQFKDANKIEKKYPWAVGYVAVALENDLFFENESEVKPEANATRLWSTVLLIKALKLEDEAKALNNTKLDFKDAHEIPAGSVGYVALALEKGIITGYEDKKGNKTFRPNQPVTRAELAALLDRTDSEMPDHDASAIHGEIKVAPTGGALTLTKTDGTLLTLPLDSNVFIFRDDVKAPVSALKAGDKVFLRTYQGKVVFIEVTQNAEEDDIMDVGIIHSLNFNSNAKLQTLTLKVTTNNETKYVIYNIADDVVIVGDAAKLKADQAIRVSGDNNKVDRIEILS